MNCQLLTAGPAHPPCHHNQAPASAPVQSGVANAKPAVDARYPTLNARAATFIMGSSMGGLASLQALCEYPKIFGAAACLSTHWIGSSERNDEIPAALLEYLRRKLPAADQIRIYMDRGTRDLDALYDSAQAKVDAMFAEKGYGPTVFISKSIR